MPIPPNPKGIGYPRHVFMNRTERIDWIIGCVKALSKDSGKDKIPVSVAIQIAQRLGVTRKTAVEYIDHIRTTRVFGFDGANFIVEWE